MASLVIIIDANVAHWHSDPGVKGFPDFWAGIKSFARMFRMLQRDHKVMLLTADSSEVKSLGQGQDLRWSQAYGTTLNFLYNAREGEPMIAKAISKGLCFLNASQFPTQRILIVEATSGNAAFSKQYVGLMNTFFAAKKSNVILDVMTVHGNDPSMLLKQGTIICDGEHLEIGLEKTEEILPILTFHCLRDVETARVLKRRQEVEVLASVCFCHLSPVQMGFVCSTCLAILCKDTVEADGGKCPLCESSFRK